MDPNKAEATGWLGIATILIASIVSLVKWFFPRRHPPLRVTPDMEPTPDQEPEEDPPGHRICIVDDERSILDSLLVVLEPEGYTISTHQEPVAALDDMRRNKFDVLIADLNLKSRQMSGLDLIGAAQEQHEAIVVVIITGSDADTASRSAKRVGAVGYLLKPMKLDQVRREIQNAFDVSWARRK